MSSHMPASLSVPAPPRVGHTGTFRLGVLAWLFVLVSGISMALAEETPPAVMISLRSVDKLLHGLEQIPHARELLERLPLSQHLAVVDRTGAWTLCVFVNEQQPDRPGVVVSVPVRDMQELARLVQGYSFVSLRPGTGDAWILQLPAKRIEARYVNKLLYVATDARNLAGAESHTAGLADLIEKYDLALRVQVSGLPTAWRAEAARKFADELAHVRSELENEDRLPQRLRVQGLEILNEVARRIAEGTDRIDAGIRIDGDLELEAEWVAQEGSALAEDFAQLHLTGMNWEGTLGDAASSVQMALQLPPWLRSHLEETVRLLRKRAAGELANRAPAADQQAALGAFDSLLASLHQGHVQGWLGFVPGANRKMSFLGLLSVEEPAQLQKALAELLPLLSKNSEIASVEQAEMSREIGVIHRIQRARVRPREERLYGANPAVYLGVVRQMFAFSLGSSSCEDLLKEVRPEPREHAPLLILRWSSHPWLNVATPGADAEKLQEIFPTDKDDNLTITVTGQNRSVRCHVTAEEGYLRLLGLAVARW